MRNKRYFAIWFRHLLPDWKVRQQPELAKVPFVFAIKERGRKVVSAVTPEVGRMRISPGTVLADAKAAIPGLEVFDEPPGQKRRLLQAFAEWCIRYSPAVGIDEHDGLILDISGCAHLWGGEREYYREVITRLRSGYNCRGAIADTIGAACAVARYGQLTPIIEPGNTLAALEHLPAAALRLDAQVLDKLQRLGMYRLKDFIHIPAASLRRRFGPQIVERICQALGTVEERFVPVAEPVPYQERLPCMEAIRTANGIEKAIEKLLEAMCTRLSREGKGMRNALLRCYRTDNRIVEASIGTSMASANAAHLLSLFKLKIPGIAPGLGIELFTLDASGVEPAQQRQEKLWTATRQNDQAQIAEFIDRVEAKIGKGSVHRYLPAKHHWPERSLQEAAQLTDKPTISWPRRLMRPVTLMRTPQPIQVTAPIPDYPPMMFIYKGVRHDIKKAEGPERIEREWWIDEGMHRDYYILEDESGKRYWVFRSGHYLGMGKSQWFIHGYFA